MLKAALAFVGAIDRLPLPVKSSPGFLVNRGGACGHSSENGRLAAAA
jgi:hypothetical protein